MEKTYVYLHHLGFDFYLENRELSQDERYCNMCDEEDVLIGIYETEEALKRKLAHLFMEGYDLLPCKEYDRIKERYCPSELLQWESMQEEHATPHGECDVSLYVYSR